MTTETFVHPTTQDVLDVKVLLTQATLFPPELIDYIIDWAEYWPCLTTATDSSFSASGSLGGQHRHRQDVLVLRSAPIGYDAAVESLHPYSVPLKDFANTANKQPKFPLPDVPAQADLTAEFLQDWTTRSLRRGRPCRKIVFTIKSKDQGWGGAPNDRRTYNGSFTWFDVGKEKFTAVDPSKISDERPVIETAPQEAETEEERAINAERQADSGIEVQTSPRETLLARSQCASSTSTTENVQVLLQPVMPTLDLEHNPPVLNHPFLPSDMCLQKNLTADKTVKEHIITWSVDDSLDPASMDAHLLENIGRGRATANGDFIKELEIGDVVTVWARARFPGWTNQVHSVTMDVFWAV